MELYNFSYEYFLSFIKELFVILQINYEKLPLVFFCFGILVAILLINKRINKLEKIQINDINDVTSFNRLIDDEIGILNERYDRQKGLFNKSKGNDEIKHEKLFNNAPYTQAVHLAQRGYTRDDIISLCTLTESEAELILALHANSKAA